MSDEPVEESPKPVSRTERNELQQHNGRPAKVEPSISSDLPPLMDKLGGFHIKKMSSSPSKHDLYTPERAMKKSRSLSRSKSPENNKKDLRNRSRSTSRKRYRWGINHRINLGVILRQRDTLRV